MPRIKATNTPSPGSSISDMSDAKALREHLDERQLPILGMTLFRTLYPNVPQTPPAVEKPLRGGYNIVFPLRFGNGLRWMVRIPMDGTADKWNERAAAELVAEVNTMRLLCRETTIPLPEVLDYSSTLTNTLGCPYMVMTFIDGVPLEDVWFGVPDENLALRRRRALEGLSDAMCQLSKFSFKTGGVPLFDRNGNLTGTGPMMVRDADARLLANRQDPVYAEYAVSADPKYYYTYMLNKHPRDHPYKQGIDALLRQLIAWIPEVGPDQNPFVLAHPDLHLNNVLVSEDGFLCGIIDWAGTVAVPRSRGNEAYPEWLLDEWLTHGRLMVDDRYILEAFADGTEDSPETLAEYRALYNEMMMPKVIAIENGPTGRASPDSFLRAWYQEFTGPKKPNFCSVSLVGMTLATAEISSFHRGSFLCNFVNKALQAAGEKKVTFHEVVTMFSEKRVPPGVMKTLHKGFDLLLYS